MPIRGTSGVQASPISGHTGVPVPSITRGMSIRRASGYKDDSVAPGGYPRRFGSYVLLKPLARGGMGELDLAVTGLSLIHI